MTQQSTGKVIGWRDEFGAPQSKSNPPRFFFLPDPQQKNWETTPWRFHCFFFTKIFVVLGNTLFLFLPILIVLLIPKRLKKIGEQNHQSISGWWFQTFFMFTPIWGRFPFWLIFFRWVGSTTNQIFLRSFSNLPGLALGAIVAGGCWGEKWLKNQLLTAGRKVMGNVWFWKPLVEGVTSKNFEYQDVACCTPISRLFAVKMIVKSMMIQV